MKVSVIIPTYGIPLFLDKAIQSVLNQTISDFQLIVVDDNNPDTEARNITERVLKPYLADDRVVYLKHTKNRNGAVARNTGISVAEGEYIAFLDSDDEYLPNRLEKCLKKIEHSDWTIAGVYTGCEFRKAGKTVPTYVDVKAGNFLVETLACTFAFCTGSNIFIKKSIVEEINGFDGDFLRHQDYEFLVRIFQKYSLEALPEVLVIKNNELFNLPNLQKMIDIKKQYLKKYSSIIENLPISDRNYIYKSQFLQLAEAAQKIGDMRNASKFYELAKSYSKLSLKEKVRRIAFLLIAKTRN